MGSSSTDRYQVCVYGRLRDGAPLGSVDVTQGFSSRGKAERFARAVSHCIPAGRGSDGCTLAWVLVYAMPDSTSRHHSGTLGHCYMALDHGGVVVKRHAILPGHHGYRAAALAGTV